MIARAPAGSPWYRNSWPWFIVALLGISVVGSLATVYVAFVHRDIEIDRSAPVIQSVGTSEMDDGR